MQLCGLIEQDLATGLRDGLVNIPVRRGDELDLARAQQCACLVEQLVSGTDRGGNRDLVALATQWNPTLTNEQLRMEHVDQIAIRRVRDEVDERHTPLLCESLVQRSTLDCALKDQRATEQATLLSLRAHGALEILCRDEPFNHQHVAHLWEYVNMHVRCRSSGRSDTSRR